MQAGRIALHPGQTHITIQSHKSPLRTLSYRYLPMYKLYVVNKIVNKCQLMDNWLNKSTPYSRTLGILVCFYKNGEQLYILI